MRHYAKALSELAGANGALRRRLEAHEEDARRLSAAEPQESSWHTAGMLKDLAESGEWALLRQQADRHLESPDPEAARLARRMLALALAHSTERADKEAAIAHYSALAVAPSGEPTDYGSLALLLAERGDAGGAQRALLTGIERCPANADGYFMDIGHRLVEATGDRAFRKELEAAIAQRGRS